MALTFTIVYTVPTNDGEEGNCKLTSGGDTSQPLMQAHEWGHLMARVMQCCEEYYLKCLSAGGTPPPAALERASVAIWEGVVCESKNPTTYAKPSGKLN